MTDIYDPEETAERPLSAGVARHAEDELKPKDAYVGNTSFDDVADGGDIAFNEPKIIFQGDAVNPNFARGGVINGPVSDGDDSIPIPLNPAKHYGWAKGPEPVSSDILTLHLQGQPIQAIKVYRDRYVSSRRVAGYARLPVYDMSLSEIKKHIEATVASLSEGERALLAGNPSDPVHLLPGFSAPDHMPGGGINVELRHEDPAEVADKIRRRLENGSVFDPHFQPAAEYSIDEDAPSVYVAGPMRGKAEHNYPTFNAVTENLRRQGFIVKNPAENFDGDQSHELSEYMELDLQMVMDTDGIVLLPGWRDSELGRIEAAMAKALEHKFYEATLVDETDASYGVDPFSPDSWVINEIPTPTSTDNRGIDGEARSLVYGARNADYGPPSLDFTVVGRIWAALLSAHLQEHVDDIPPTIVAVMLTGLKLGRQGRTPGHHDSRVDVVGYQLCLDRIVTNDGATPDD